MQIDGVEYRLCQPRLNCAKCNLFVPTPIVTYADDFYYDLMKEPDRWFFPDIVSTFGVLLSHDAHREDMMYIDSTIPDGETVTSNAKVAPLSETVETIVAVAYNIDHFAVLRLVMKERFVHVYDGIQRKVRIWHPHVKYILHQYGIDHNGWKMGRGVSKDVIDGIKVIQKDHSSCGPIACVVLWKLFLPHEIDLTKINQEDYRELVIEKLRKLLQKHEDACILYRRKKREIDEVATAIDSSNRSTDGKDQKHKFRSNTHPTAVTLDGNVPKTSELVLPDNTPVPNEIKTKSKSNKRKKTSIAKTSKGKSSIKTFFSKAKTSDQISFSKLDVEQEKPQKKDEKTIVSLFESDDEVMPQKKKSKKKIVEEEEYIPTSSTDIKETQTNNIQRSSSPIPSLEITQQSLTSKPSPRKKRNLLFDGLSDDSDNVKDGLSHTDDDDFIESEVLELAARNQPTKKHRIKITIPKPKSTPGSKCHCKKGCNHLCGCRRGNRKCGNSCACRGNCNNI